MTQQPRFAGVKGDECQCGRRASVRHCPSCGSARLYGYARPEYYKDKNGNVTLVEKLFRCQSCSLRFVDEDREFCEAPPFGSILAAQRVKALKDAEKSGEYIRPEHREALKAINNLLPKELLVETPREFTDTELRNLDFTLRREWVRLRMNAKQNGQKFDETVYDFVIRMLKESNHGEVVIQRIKEMHERDKSAEQSNSSTAGS